MIRLLVCQFCNRVKLEIEKATFGQLNASEVSRDVHEHMGGYPYPVFLLLNFVYRLDEETILIRRPHDQMQFYFKISKKPLIVEFQHVRMR